MTEMAPSFRRDVSVHPIVGVGAENHVRPGRSGLAEYLPLSGEGQLTRGSAGRPM